MRVDLDVSYRRAAALARAVLDGAGLPAPSYGTFHRLEGRYLAPGGVGRAVMREAASALRSEGFAEECVPQLPVFTRFTPGYEAPQMVVTSLAEQQAQGRADAEAEEMRRGMAFTVFEDAVTPGAPVDLAVDGSGEAVSGPGTYIEHMWGVSDRRFIKQHAVVDIGTKKVVGLCVTMEKPGDAKVLPFIARGLAAAGVRVANLYADSAYDSAENWRVCDELGIGFHPNLKGRFRDVTCSESRAEELNLESVLGKSLFHRIVGYNVRWHVECFFSYTKKLYGQAVRNRRFGRMAITMRLKYILYNRHRDCMLRALRAAEVRLDERLTTVQEA